MGLKPNIPEWKVAQISALHGAGFTQQAISSRLKVSQSSVNKALTRIRERGDFTAREKSGRPRITSRQTDSVMRRIVTADPTASASFIATQLPEGVHPSVHTIRRRLRNDFGLRAYRPARKPLLSRKNIKDRLRFCRAYRQWSMMDWNRVMFSDESLIRQFWRYAPYIRRPVGQRYNRRYTIPAVKISPSSMIWGAISARGPIRLSFVPPKTTVNAHVYINILEDRLCDGMARMHCDVFQHDGAPCHTARIVKGWLNTHGIQLLEPWPGASPDLNPIEHCWARVKSEVAKLRPTSQYDLNVKIRRVWRHHITPAFCKKLVQSMPKRIAAVLKAHGGPSKY